MQDLSPLALSAMLFSCALTTHTHADADCTFRHREVHTKQASTTSDVLGETSGESNDEAEACISERERNADQESKSHRPNSPRSLNSGLQRQLLEVKVRTKEQRNNMVHVDLLKYAAEVIDSEEEEETTTRRTKTVTSSDRAESGPLHKVQFTENCLNQSWWKRMPVLIPGLQWKDTAKRCLDPMTTEGGFAMGLTLWYVAVATLLNLDWSMPA